MGKIGSFHVAVSVLIERDNKILITKRSAKREHAPNEWELGVTGRLNEGETFEQAAIREVQEEIGIKVSLIAPFDTFHFYRNPDKSEHIGLCYWGVYKDGEISLNLSEQSEYKWVDINESRSYITNQNVVKELDEFIYFKKHYSF